MEQSEAIRECEEENMNFTINQWIEKGKDLPVLSGSIADILSLTEGVQSNVSRIAEVIKRDISLSAAILRITNSSAFGLLRKITTIDQAVVYLGFLSVRNIALGVGVFNMFPPKEKDFLAKVWRRSLVTALAARELCNLTGKNRKKEDAFTAGLLLDIGLVAFYGFDKLNAARLLVEAEENGRNNLDDEKISMGLDHVEAGVLLAERWKLPEDIILTMKYHHKEPLNDSPETDNETLTNIVYLASLVGDIFYLGNKRENLKKYADECQRLLGVNPDDSDNLLRNIHPQLAEVASYFDIAVGSGNTYDEILCMVSEEIVNITVSNEAIKHHLINAFEREKTLSLQLEEANRSLKVLANKDALTGLYNRQFLDEWLEKEWLRAQRYDNPLSVVMADVDNFKRVNDNYGHQAGDIVLKKIADVLKKNLRKNEVLARYGGEEFIFVLPQTNMQDACMAAERFKSAVRSLKILIGKDKRLEISVSCGVYTAHPGRKEESVDSLIQKADHALYEAKESGKDQVIIYKCSSVMSG
jgi:two-component system, cell cycle response regulator